MSTTELAVTNRQELILEERGGRDERNAFDFLPTRIKMPSGGLKVFTLSDGDTLAPFTGVIAVSQKARAYWPDKDTQGLPPLCSSPDGVSGWFNEQPDSSQIDAAKLAPSPHIALDYVYQDRGPHECARCPLSAWGSGEGRGQACKTLRRLLVLVDGWSMPALLTLPPTSVRTFDQYASGRASKGSAYFAVRTRLELEQKKTGQGITYSTIKLSYVEDLPDDMLSEVMAIRGQFADLVRSMDIVAEEYEEGPPF